MRHFAFIGSVLVLVSLAALSGCKKSDEAAATPTTAPAPKTDGTGGQLNDSHTVTPTRPTFQPK